MIDAPAGGITNRYNKRFKRKHEYKTASYKYECDSNYYEYIQSSINGFKDVYVLNKCV